MWWLQLYQRGFSGVPSASCERGDVANELGNDGFPTFLWLRGSLDRERPCQVRLSGSARCVEQQHTLACGSSTTTIPSLRPAVMQSVSREGSLCGHARKVRAGNTSSSKCVHQSRGKLAWLLLPVAKAGFSQTGFEIAQHGVFERP